MSITIGVLLPRSTDFPAMGFDLLDGIKLSLKEAGHGEVLFVPENIGFGEDRKEIYSKAEKLVMQDDADIVVAYLSSGNAESLYPLFDSIGRPLIVLDPGMNFPEVSVGKNAFHISLQGIQSCSLAGQEAGKNNASVILATSFYDGGYRGPWASTRGVESAGASIVGNFVGHYQESQFTIQPMVDLIHANPESKTAACFSTYLATLFINRLHEANETTESTEFYCSSYMFEEQTCESYTLPKGKFFAFIPWFSGLSGEKNHAFVNVVRESKNKKANIFHLLGWEAGIVVAQLIDSTDGIQNAFFELMKGASYESPRGLVTISMKSQTAIAPLHKCALKTNENGNTTIEFIETVPVSSEGYEEVMRDIPEGMTSGWFNNYLCT